MFSVDFALIISKLIKESFGFDCIITDEKALILVSTYEDDKPYSTDLNIKRYIETIGRTGSAKQELSNDETIVYVKNNNGTMIGFVHIKQALDSEVRSSLSQFINVQYRHEFLHTEIELERSNNEKLIQYVLSDITPQISKAIKNLASKLNYDMSHPMAAIVAQIEENRFSYFNMDMGYSSAIKATKERIIKEIRNNYHFNNRDIIAFTDEGFLIIFKAFFSMDDLATLYNLLHKNVEQVDIILRKYKIFKYIISNGHIVEHYSKIHFSYKEAIRNIEISKLIGLNSSIIFPEDILFEKLVDNFSVELIDLEIIPLVKKISKIGMAKSIELLNLFEQFCTFDFSISETSSRCFLHRNTVSQKLDKLKEITGLDPMGKLRDRLLLNLLYSYIKVYKPDLK